MKQKWSRRGFLQGLLATSTSVSLIKDGHAEEQQENSASILNNDNKNSSDVVIQCHVNGNSTDIFVSETASALDTIRGQLGLRGSKRGCAQGVCGACIVHIDGKAINSCILPASDLHNTHIQTIEAFQEKEHPVQRAFMAKDALQCGYCTPGFIMEAIPFVDQWRKENTNTPPSREVIAEALSGHLCRCAAYDGIYEAVAGACAGDFDQPLQEPPPRQDAREKALGIAQYTSDIDLPNMLHVAMLRSEIAHGVLLSLNTSAAEQAPGVVAVYSVISAGFPIRFAGQEIVAIAAESYEQARVALRLVEVEWEEKKALPTMAAALATEAPNIYSKEQQNQAQSAAEGPSFGGGKWNGNRRGPASLPFFSKPKKTQRNIAAAQNGNGLIYKEVYETHVQAHTSLEPHGCVADWQPDQLTVWSSSQTCHHTASDISERWDIPIEKVQVYTLYIGGGFGSKGTSQPELLVAIELSKQSKRPVKYILRREEELIVGGIRPAARIEITIADNDGLSAIQLLADNDSGVAVGSSVATVPMILYPTVPKNLQDWDVITNGPPGMPFRGPGGPAGLWALEQSIDAIASQRNIDPVEYRLANDKDPARQRLLTWTQGLDVWKQRSTRKRSDGHWMYGVGMATSSWLYLLNPKTQMLLQTTSDGQVILSSACQDMGNGSRSAVAWAAATALNLSRDRIQVQFGDSTLPIGAGSYGSQTTASMVPTTLDAVHQLKEELFDDAVELFDLDSPTMSDEGITHSSGILSWGELLTKIDPIQVLGRRRKDKDGYRMRFGPFALGKAQPGAVQIYEIAVHKLTGQIRVIEGWMGLAAGKIISPPIAKSQVLGGMLQGIGYTLYEHRLLDSQTGIPLSTDLNDYHLLGIGDAPKMNVYFDQQPLTEDPNLACGLSEMATVASAAAIGNAFFHATGKRMNTLPMNPTNVLRFLQEG